MYVDDTANLWQTSESLGAFLNFLDQKVNLDTPQSPWMMVLDGASIHIVTESRLIIKEDNPWIIPAFWSSNTTGHMQPLDMMRGFKSSCAALVISHLPEHCSDKLTPPDMVLDYSLRSMKPLLPSWVSQVLGELSARDSLHGAWKHIRPPSVQAAEDILQSATRHQAQGSLFRNDRKG